jgi:hypothetical protein
LDGTIALLKKKCYNEALTVGEESHSMVALRVKMIPVFRNKDSNELSDAANNVILQEIPLLEWSLPAVKLITKIAPMISFVGVLQIATSTVGTMAHIGCPISVYPNYLLIIIPQYD